MIFPGNTPIELAPYLAPGLDVPHTQALVAHMRRVLGSDSHLDYEPQWAEFCRKWLRAHARQLKRLGAHTSTIATAIANQPGDRVVLRYFMLLAGELSM
jgi:hypothetical protein